MAISNLSTSSMVSGVKRRKIWDQSATTDGFFQIATTTVGATSVADVTFSSIPADYTHLQIRCITRSNDANNYAQNLNIRFNSDTASNYSRHGIEGDGAAVYAFSTLSTYTVGGIVTGNGQGANIFSSNIIDIYDYANTNKFKTTRALCGNDANSATGQILFQSGNWRSTNAITSIRLYSAVGNLIQYSRFDLYGVKA